MDYNFDKFMTNILHWLLPKEDKFFDMLKEQASNVIDGAYEFKNLINDYDDINNSKRIILVKKIKDIESKGDDLTHKIISDLDKTFITPIDKEDIHRLVNLLDDVIDLIYTASMRLIIFKIDKIDSYIMDLTVIVEEVVKKIKFGIGEISKLKNMNEFYVDIHTLENKGDDIYHNALAKMFDRKDVIEIIKYREIYGFLEDIIDKCEDIANVMESIVVKHA